MKKIGTTLAMLFMVMTCAMAGNEVKYSFASAAEQTGWWGTQKAESYDVAVRIADPFLVGKQVKGVSVPFPMSADITDCKMWMSKALTLATVDGKKQNVPDIESVEAVPADGVLAVTFSSPYTIPEEGVYVGYSFNVSSVESADAMIPLACAGSVNEDGFYIHSSRTYRNWVSKSEALGLVSMMEVVIAGEFADYSVGISSLGVCKAAAGLESTVKATLVNYGSVAVSSVDYDYTVGSVTKSGKYDLDQPIDAVFGKVCVVDLPLEAIDVNGVNPLRLTITKVNGNANENEIASAESEYQVFSFIPVRRPVVEEYTGTWCGYCPRGFAGLEEMNRLYPDRFIGISYHNDDAMQVVSSSSEFPSYINGYPAAWLDRVAETDAYCGDGSYGVFGIDKAWMARASEMAPADVDVKAEFNADNDKLIDVTTSLMFPISHDNANYLIGYALVADDMTGEGDGWIQSNYYSGQTSWSDQPGMDIFVEGGSAIVGLHYNDVAVIVKDVKGVDGSVPASVEEQVAVSHSYQFDTDDAVCQYNAYAGQNVIQNRNNLSVVALLIDAATGEIVNANKAHVANGTSGISGVGSADRKVVSVTCYDSMGRSISSAANGVNIKKVVFSDGTVKTVKVVK